MQWDDCGEGEAAGGDVRSVARVGLKRLELWNGSAVGGANMVVLVVGRVCVEGASSCAVKRAKAVEMWLFVDVVELLIVVVVVVMS